MKTRGMSVSNRFPSFIFDGKQQVPDGKFLSCRVVLATVFLLPMEVRLSIPRLLSIPINCQLKEMQLAKWNIINFIPILYMYICGFLWNVVNKISTIYIALYIYYILYMICIYTVSHNTRIYMV